MFKKVLSRLKLSCNRNNILILISLTTILLFSAYLRLVNLTKVGMIGADVFQYWEIAKWWTEGNYTLDGFYRPAIYLIDSLAIRLFGPHDYSLSLLHALMDLLNISLIFYITNIISKNKWVGLSASFMYAFFPSIINFSRSSLIHIPSATFVLLSLLFFLKFDEYVTSSRKRSIFYLGLTGLSTSINAHIHPDLAFFAPVYTVLIFFSLKKKASANKTTLFLQYIPYAIVFSVAFISIYLMGMFFYGFFTVISILLWERSEGTQNSYPLKMFATILSDSVSNHTLSIIPFLLFGTIPVIILRKILRQKDKLSSFAPVALTFGYGLIGSFLLTRYISRLVIPLIPMIVISITIWYKKGLELILRNEKLAVIGILLLSIIITKNNFDIHKPELMKQLAGKQTIYKEAFDFMKDKTDWFHKMLVTPYIFYSHRKGFQAPFYFGGNTPYIIDFPYSGYTLEELIREKHIKYIYFSKVEHDSRILKQSKREVPIDFYGLRKDDWENGYSVEEEMKILNEFIQRNKTQKIFESENGTIYELN